MATRIISSCPNCGRKLKVDEQLVGKHVRCPKCQTKFVLSSVSFSPRDAADPSMDALQTRADGETAGGSLGAHRDDSAGSLDGRLGRFELRKKLGDGGFGVVYRAFDPVLGREVALKVPKFGAQDAARMQRFLVEARAAAKLHHPNIVAVFESGEIEGTAFIASEYVKGATLSARLKAHPPTIQQAAQWARALADALAYAHDEGIIHRDIKPDNILMAAKDRPQITDFGLAKRTDEDSLATSDGSILGTPAYMSPEQARGEIEFVGPRSDQYSLGVVLYELLTGKRPFEGPPHVVLAQVTEQDPPSPRKRNPDIPEDLAAICQKAMEKEHSRRYADMHDVSDDLDRWLSGRETHARPLSLLEKGRRWYRKNTTIARLWLAVAALVVVVLVVGSADYARTKYIVQQQSAKLEESSTDLSAAEAARSAAQRSLAINQFERGRNLCEAGSLEEGLLWLARGLENLPSEMTDLEAPIRGYLGSWLPQVHHLRHVIPHEGNVNSVAFSPDGQRLMTGSGDVYNASVIGKAQLWNAATGAPIGSAVEHRGAVTAVAFSPDGRLAAAASFEKTVSILNPATGEPLRRPLDHPDRVVGLVFSPDGRRLATSCFDEFVRVWDTTTWEIVGSPLHHQRRRPNQGYNERYNPQPLVARLAFAPDGTSLLTADLRAVAPGIRWWDLTSGAERALPNAKRWGELAGFTPDGRQLAYITPSGTVALVDLDNPQGSETIIARDDEIEVWDFARSVGLILSGNAERVAWTADIETGARFGQMLRHDGPVRSVAVAPDGRTLATAGNDKLLRIWSVAEQRPWGRTIPHNGLARVAKFFPDGNSFMTGDMKWEDERQDGNAQFNDRVRIWNTQTLERIGGPFEHLGGLSSADISSDGKLYARGNWNSAEICSVADGKQVVDRILHPGRVTALAFTNDDRTLITGCENGEIAFYDLDRQDFTGEPVSHTGGITNLCISPDGRLFASTSRDGTARIWDIASRRPLCDPLSHPKAATHAAFHPDNSMLATSADDGSVYFWTVPDGEEARTPLYSIDARGGLPWVSFTPDGRSIVTLGHRRGAQVWDLATGLPASRRILHSGWVGDARMSPDGRNLACRSFSYRGKSQIQLWPIVPPIGGSPGSVRLQIETTIGLELRNDNELGVLDGAQWKEKSDRLAQTSGRRLAASE